jgi:putative restriction endonuclease
LDTVAWNEDLLGLLSELPSRFKLEDAYRFIPRLHELHPTNNHLREKIRQTLQNLREQGKIRFLEKPGTYENLDKSTNLRDNLGLTKGQTTTREELANLMELKSSAALRRGIFPPAKGPLQKHIFLFHNARENPYGDVHEDGLIRYVGQGADGDQELAHFNRSLANHLQDRKRVHYFVQPKESKGELRYLGEVVLKEVRRVFRPAQNRSVLEFLLVPSTDVEALEAYGSFVDSILTDRGPPRLVARDRAPSLQHRVLRDAAFRDLILQAYRQECSVCGEPLRHNMAIELQAAHIAAVSDGGEERLDNGLALCVRHHWAFDAGVFSLTDRHEIQWLAAGRDPHGEIVNGERIQLPEIEADRPAPFYLGVHRAKWNGRP